MHRKQVVVMMDLTLSTVGKLTKTTILKMDLMKQESVTAHVEKEVAVMGNTAETHVNLKEVMSFVICAMSNVLTV